MTLQESADQVAPAGSPVSDSSGDPSPDELSRAFVEGTAAMVCLVDGNGRIMLANPALQRFTGQAAADLTGRAVWNVFVAPEDVSGARADVAHAMAGAQPFSLEADWLAASGGRRRVEMQISVLRNATGEPYGVACVGIDVSEQRQREALTHQRATTDALTGVRSRSVLFEVLQEQLDARTGGGCGLLFCDVDDFKTINDQHGHVVGDRLLVEVASRLLGVAGPDDVVARFGGDEFVLLSPGADHGHLAALARRVGSRMAAPFAAPAGQLHIGVSVGIATGRPGETPDDLIARADRDMYGAKTHLRRRHPRTASSR